MAREDAPTQEEVTQEEGKSRQSLIMIFVIVGIMILEGGGIFVAMKFFGSGPGSAQGMGLVADSDPTARAVDYVELLVVKFKAPNMKSGKTCMYDLEVYTRIKPDRAEDLKEILLKCEATVKDRLNRLVRSAEQETLREDGLETLRLQIRHELSAIIGDEKLIEEILIPRCTPLNLGY